MTLSRRDRAACALAYEELRSGVLYSEVGIGDMLTQAGDVLAGLDISIMRWPVVHDVVPARVVRARLALALRALLRADRGDFGPYWVCRCLTNGWHSPKGIRACQRCSWCGATPPLAAARIRPLWEQAGGRRG